jgi:hypothetical protein
MENADMLSTLPHELHEWIEIQVGSEGAGFWVYGLYSPGGRKQLRYDDALIAVCLTREEAIRLGESIAQQASAARLIAGLPFCCSFKEEL